VIESTGAELTPAADSIVLLDSLNIDSPPNVWERYFVQRGAGIIWELLQNPYARSYADLKSTQQVDEVIAGMLSYLNCYQIPIKDLMIAGLIHHHPNLGVIRFPSNPVSLPELQILRLPNNLLSYMPLNLYNLTSITSLDLSNNDLVEIHSEIGKITFLKELNLTSNRIKVIPKEIGNLGSLEILDLYSNQLSFVPSEINKLTSLTQLNISSNQLTAIPSLDKLICLRTLLLSRNKFTLTGTDIVNLSNLTCLDLSYNKLSTLPTCTFRKLTSLHLSNNNIKELPVLVSEYTALKALDLANNQLESLPREIGCLTNLRNLCLRGNRLTHIPYEIGNLINLLRLILSKNKIEILPSELSNLTELILFDIASNQLTKLPASLIPTINNPKVKVVLDNNRWLTVDASPFIKLGLSDVILSTYYRFPHSLLIMCMEAVETQLTPQVKQELERNLPTELGHEARKVQLKDAYYWEKGKDIIFFKNVQKKNFPFYLDFSLISPQLVTYMLRGLKQNAFYQEIKL
jgi:Leucine-rich repeat (LRR) protein